MNRGVGEIEKFQVELISIVKNKATCNPCFPIQEPDIGAAIRVGHDVDALAVMTIPVEGFSLLPSLGSGTGDPITIRSLPCSSTTISPRARRTSG